MTEHKFGGNWTEKKLSALTGYLSAYCTALSRQSWELWYIDGFAGSGERVEEDDNLDLLEESRLVRDGSARIAVQQGSFARYIFIEKDAQRAAQLHELAQEHPDKDITIISGDANEEVVRICQSTDWTKTRALMFLDPYGMAVKWATLEAIAATRAVDLWLLVPIGQALVRMLTKSGKIPTGWIATLDEFFGTSDWLTEVYQRQPSKQGNLLGEVEEDVNRATMDELELYVTKRLKTIFPYVHNNAVRLKANSNWLFSLFFAISSESKAARRLGREIAGHIINKLKD